MVQPTTYEPHTLGYGGLVAGLHRHYCLPTKSVPRYSPSNHVSFLILLPMLSALTGQKFFINMLPPFASRCLTIPWLSFRDETFSLFRASLFSRCIVLLTLYS